MIPISLSIEGLYSYRSKQEIDFQQLTEAQLFGIFGPTGSGKSAILEAITFALYGQSARLNQRDNRGYNMMNLRSDRLQIEFVFEANEVTYQFVVQGRRNRKRFDDVRSMDRRAFRLEEGELVPLDIIDASSILGLSYDNFRRTIIIPQDKFQEFLQLGETERTRMLKEIFHLERFELAGKVKRLEEKNRLHLNEKETLLLQLETITDTAQQALVGQIATEENQLSEEQKRQQKLDKEQQQFEALQQLFSKIEAQQKLLLELNGQNEAFTQKEQQLQAYEQCLIDFKPLLDRRTELQEQLQSVQQQLSGKKSALTDSEKDLGKSEQLFAKIESEFQQRDQYLRQAEELRRMIELKQLHKLFSDKQQRQEKGEKMLEDLRAEISSSRSKIDSIRQQQKGLQDNLPDISDVMSVQSWFTGKREIDNQLRNHRKSLSSLQQDQEALDRDKKKHLEQLSLDRRQFELSISDLMVLLEKEEESLSLRKEQADQELADTLLSAQLKQLQEQLVEGEPCPLCGSVHHVDKPDFGNVAFYAEKAREQLKSIEGDSLTLQKVMASLQAIRQQWDKLDQQIAEQKNMIQELESDLARKMTAFVWPQFNREDETSVQLHLDRFRTSEAELKKLEQEKQAIETSISDQQNRQETYAQALKDIQADAQKLMVDFEAKKGGLRHRRFDEEAAKSDAQLQSESDQARQQHDSIAETHRTYQDRLKRLRENTAKLKGEIQVLHKQEQDLTARMAQQVKEIEQQLVEADFETLAEVEACLKQNWNLSAEKESIRRFRQALHAAREKQAELQAEAKGKSFDQAAFIQLQEKLATLAEQIADRQIRIGSLRNELTRMEADLTRKKALLKEQQQLEVRAEDLRTLRNLFRSSGFVNFVSTIYLQNICRAANDRFMRLTRGALRLEKAVDSNNFEVIDQLNGGKRRSVKTLSGGQTFQASLCLALALADQVQQQATAPQNFFFLDEGFGSQDKQSLQIIFDTLKSLRQENRIVGVISHVEEMQQEIGACLLISNDGDTGSVIRSSWEV
ncbi:MAG: SMC family ATPase [Bacteroidota bacterium]